MKSMDIKSLYGDYQVHFCSGIDYGNIIHDGDIAVTDRKVYELYEDELGDFLTKENAIVIDASEEQKSYAGIIPVMEEIIRRGFHKNSRLIAIGGGITQDVTAFTASILYRGVKWEFIPTTLLAQCDSCIGSKTSINFASYKNQVGGFYPARNVYIAPHFLKTLHEEEMKSGLGEMLHYYVAGGEEDFNFFAENCMKAMHDFRILLRLIRRSLEIKKIYIEIDECDRKERQIFNYGHTFGHALESVTNYGVPHGIAVSYGMDIANKLSVEKGMLDRQVRSRIRDIVKNFWSSYYVKNINIDAYIRALSKDKKNEGDRLGAILCSGYGKLSKNMLDMDEEFCLFLKDYFQNDAVLGK